MPGLINNAISALSPISQAEAAEVYTGPAFPPQAQNDATPGRWAPIRSYLEGRTDKINAQTNPCDVVAREIYQSLPTDADKHYLVNEGHTVVLVGGKVIDPLFHSDPKSGDPISIPLKDYQWPVGGGVLQMSNETKDGFQWHIASDKQTFITPDKVGP